MRPSSKRCVHGAMGRANYVGQENEMPNGLARIEEPTFNKKDYACIHILQLLCSVFTQMNATNP